MKQDFFKIIDEIGIWDPTLLIEDLKNLVVKTGCDWNQWSWYNTLTTTKYATNENVQKQGNLNLTCNLGLCANLEDQLFNYSGRRFRETSSVNHSDLHTLNPLLIGTYTEKLYKCLVQHLGPIYLRIHNKADNVGLYLHQDIDYTYNNGDYRYHIVLWTNPGHQIIWSPDKIPWQKGPLPEHNTKEYEMYAKFLPANGKCYRLATGKFVHGVSSMGIGYTKGNHKNSRCHLVAIPIEPTNRYSKYQELR